MTLAGLGLPSSSGKGWGLVCRLDDGEVSVGSWCLVQSRQNFEKAAPPAIQAQPAACGSDRQGCS